MTYARLTHLLLKTLAAALALLPAAQARAQDHLIVGDLSGSLKGFAKQSPKQMETLYRVLYTNSPSVQLARMPGERDEVQLIGLEKIGIFASENSYTGQTTPLAETIKRATRNYKSVSIVTDGMESNNLYLQVQEAIVPLAQDGWGVWILLLPLPFDGKYDLEQPLNAQDQRDEMVNCVKQQNPNWNITIEPTAQRTVIFTGERPLLLLMFDNDPQRGRERVRLVASGIENNLKRKPEMVELSPLYLREYAIEAAEPRTLGVNILNDGQANKKRIVTDPKEGGTVKQMMMRLAWKHPEKQISQPFEEQWMITRTQKVSWGDVQIVKQSGSDQSPGALNLTVDSVLTWGEWFRSWFSGGPVLRSEPFEFNVVSNVERQVDGWWNQWSAETTWKCPQKVFKLKSLVERISGVARDRITHNPPGETLNLRLQIGIS